MSGIRRLAFITGINRYTNKIPALGSAVKDAVAIGRVLEELHGYQVELHLDEQATLEKLRALFQGLEKRVKPSDRVVVYFAGHGIAENTDADADGPKGFFIPQDADRDKPETFLPMTEVQKALDKLPCKHLLVLLDCCFAGAFRWSKTRAVPMRPKKLYKERYERYLRDPARQVITSSSHNETALDVISGKVLGMRDAGEEHSPFAEAVIRALRDSAADIGFDGSKGDGVTTATELHLYIENIMARAEKGLGREVQKPMLWQIDDRGKGEFLFESPGKQIDLPSAMTLTAENNPYRGLEAFDEKHAAMFFGRDALTKLLAQCLETLPWIMVVGASGSGKSSLVKAGLAHHLKHTQKRWTVLPSIRPGTDPMRALITAAMALEAEQAPERPADGAPVDSGVSLAAAVQARKKRDLEIELLLIVDQLEELVTMAAKPDTQTRFFAELDRAEAAGLRVVYTLRSDFEPHFNERINARPESRFPISSMNRAELREVIEGPARERVLDFDPPSLVDELIDEVVDSPGALPLLSFTLSELYLERIKRDATDRSLKKSDYEKLGRVTGALGKRADAIVDQQPDEASKKTMERVLLRLVSLKGGEATKRRVPKQELVSFDAEETARAERIIAELSAARLVVQGREEKSVGAGKSEGNVYVEAAHDKLVTGWTHLWQILSVHRDDLPILRACATAAEEWQTHQFAADRLWNADPRLPQLEALQKKDPLRFNELETMFLRRSGQRRRNRRILLATIIAVVIVILSVTTIFALIARSNADTAREKAVNAEKNARTAESAAKQSERYALHERLIAEAERPARFTTHEQALLLAVEAAKQEETLATDTILRLAKNQVARTSRILRLSKPAVITDFAWSPKNLGRQRIVSSTNDGRVVLWNAETGTNLSEFNAEDPIEKVIWNPVGGWVLAHTGWSRKWLILDTDGDELKKKMSGEIDSGLEIVSAEWTVDGRAAMVVNDRQLLVIDTQKWETWKPYELAREKVTDAHWMPDGKSVLFCGSLGQNRQGFAEILDLTKRKISRVISDKAKAVRHCAVSPDGEWTALATEDGIELWNRKDKTPRLIPSEHAEALAFGYKTPYLAVGTSVGTAELWHVREKDNRATFTGHAAAVRQIQWSYDDQWLVSSSAGGTTLVWDTNDATKLAEPSGHDRSVTAALWNPADRSQIATSSEDETIRIFNLVTANAASLSNVVDAAYSPSGKTLTAIDNRGTLTIYEANSLEPIRSWSGAGSKLETVRYCGDDSILITRNAEGVVQTWTAESGTAKRTFTKMANFDTTPTCSPNGQFVVVREFLDTVVWDAATGAKVDGLPLPFVMSVPEWNPQKNIAVVWGIGIDFLGPGQASEPRERRNAGSMLTGDVTWSHSGTLLASSDLNASSEFEVLLYENIVEGSHVKKDAAQPVRIQSGKERIQSLSFSADDELLASAGEDGGHVWEVKTRKKVSDLDARNLTRIDFSPKSSAERIVTIDEHGIVRLFEPRSGALVALPGFSGRTVVKTLFHPAGSQMLVLASDGTARVSSVFQKDLIRQVCAQAIRNFTAAEWKRYFGNDTPYRRTCENLPEER